MKNNKFLENAEVLKVERNQNIPYSEGSVILEIKNKFIESFVSDWSDEKAFKPNEKTKVKLVLLNSNTHKSKNLKKEMIYIKSTPLATNKYLVNGEVVDITQDPNHKEIEIITLDCGMFIELKALKKWNFNIGYYVQAEGRLDAKKA